uniref:Uncharacterized protein n=1 Tax=Anguilla anguilla TaxID=7936 RepID=A0A0E9WSJ0_ANGAN
MTKLSLFWNNHLNCISSPLGYKMQQALTSSSAILTTHSWLSFIGELR